MTGQPNESWLSFDVTNLQVHEPAPALTPSIVVPVGGPFSISANFQGNGLVWTWLTNNGIQWNGNFSAEGIGPTAPDFDFPAVSGNLTAAVPGYTALLNVPGGIPVAGLYLFTCVINFTGCPGLTGFAGPLLISVA